MFQGQLTASFVRNNNTTLLEEVYIKQLQYSVIKAN